MNNSKLTLWIFIALVLGIIFGWLAPSMAIKFQPLADMFLRMVKMIIAPLLFSTLVVGIAGHGDMKSLGKIGLKTLIYFEVVTTLALIIGLMSAHFFKPGLGFNLQAQASQMQAVNQMSQVSAHTSVSDMIVHIVPTSIVQAMSEGNLLQIVVFALFFAFAICAAGKKAKLVLDFLTSTCEIMFKFTELVMFFAPVGIFAAIAATIGSNGIGVLASYFKVIVSVYAALILFVAIVIAFACKITGISFIGLLKAIQEPALIAFSTASSEAAFPKAMEVMEKFGVPKNIVSFVIPTGYTFNLDGTTLYLSLGVIFATQIVGIELSLSQQIMIMLALMLTSKGVAGVPRVSLVVMAGTLASFNYPLIGVAILLGIDQILDMGRTTVNLIGNCIASVVIARWENEFDFVKMSKFLENKNIKVGKKIKKHIRLQNLKSINNYNNNINNNLSDENLINPTLN